MEFSYTQRESVAMTENLTKQLTKQCAASKTLRSMGLNCVIIN